MMHIGKHRCAVELAHTQGCHIQKRNGKLVMHQKVKSQVNQASSNTTVLKLGSEDQLNVHRITFQSFFVIFP